MTDVASIVQDLRSTADQLEAGPKSGTWCIDLKTAAFCAGVSEAQMRRRCERAVYGLTATGYGRRIGGRWWIVLAPFIATLDVGSLHRVKTINRARMRD